MSDLLEIQNITKGFTSDGKEQVVLNELTLSFKKGEFVTILGKSGCGKSTLLRCAGGFDFPDKGSIRLDKNVIKAPSPAITMVFQTFDQLFPWKTVCQNLSYPLKIKNPRQARKELNDVVNHFLELMNLTRFADYYPHQLSGGMKQRVAIARALSLGSEVLLMDEPFASLDEQTRTVLQLELLHLWEKTGVTVLFVTHNIWESIILSTRIIVLSTPPGNIKLDIPNPLQDYQGKMRTPTDKGFTECWTMLKEKLNWEGAT